jgi:uncharacterized membrane protein YeiH
MDFGLFIVMDLIGTAAFGITGVLAARRKNLDIFAMVTVACITAIAGGSMRDAIIGNFPITWMRSYNYVIVIFLSAAIAILCLKWIKDYEKLLVAFDSVALSCFTIFGIHMGLKFNFSPAWCVMLGTVTACFAGLIRDILLGRTPLIFQKEIYATACILGGALYFLLKTVIRELPVAIVSFVVIILIRMMAMKYNWRLPSLYRSFKND